MLWSEAQLRQLDEQGVFKKNWLFEWQHAEAYQTRRQICERLLTSSPPEPILELAAGPGGGNLSPLLHLNPQANLIVNDIDPRLLLRWQRLLDRELPQHNLTFAAFDISDMPLRDGQLGAISSVAGLGSVLGDATKILHECWRVLKPGGLMAAVEHSLPKAELGRLPKALTDAWVYNPWLFNDWPELVQHGGWQIVLDEVELLSLSADSSGLAADAALFGVGGLQLERHYLLLRKQK